MPIELPHNHSEKQAITISHLYPSLTGEELKEAQENLERYARIALEIEEERSAEGRARVDSCPCSSTMKERSNVPLKT